MSKKNAFLIHLGVSVFIFIVLLLLIIYVWYPAPYFDAEYRWRWIRIIAFVDIVLGPGLTLLIYRPKKPHLKWDMTAIIAFQTIALSWGVWYAYTLHPVLNVYYDNAFYCLTPQQLKDSGADLDKLGVTGLTDQIDVVLPYPETSQDLLLYKMTYTDDTSPITQLGSRYQRATPEVLEQVGQNQKDFTLVINSNPDNQSVWDEFITRHQNQHENYSYHLISCMNGNKTAVYDREQNRIIEVLDIEVPIFWMFQ